MNLWQIARVTAGTDEKPVPVSGGLGYNESLTKLNALKRAETRENVTYFIQVWMPLRKATELSK